VRPPNGLIGAFAGHRVAQETSTLSTAERKPSNEPLERPGAERIREGNRCCAGRSAAGRYTDWTVYELMAWCSTVRRLRGGD